MLVIPAIDLRQGKCVRLTQGRKETATIYDGDPVEIAEAFEAAGARMLHIVDLDGAFAETNLRNREVLREIIRAIHIPIQFGGGLRATEDVGRVIELGVTRAVIGTVAVESPELLTEMLHLFGSKHLAVGIDARDGQVVTRGWETQEQISALTLARRVAAAGVERIVYTDVARDGTLTGTNVQETILIARESGLRVTASGGVSSLDDLRRLKALSESGIDSVILGKALYEGLFTLAEALTVADE
ncbi:MAG: 1-(5-phosphoribosyl)-5-[(5-phosphoribosylamino)methylideneamino]imidazole-4-carboxamide isomerase [Pyrinomonadaceae bacterium]|nr:1-(5-phosphoribosyl)-5-[(5-phosphoribosylamino)methylideneamino]imidazole-4-carboxamide isomerase [Pyrinomonadaceae bacterium]